MQSELERFCCLRFFCCVFFCLSVFLGGMWWFVFLFGWLVCLFIYLYEQKKKKPCCFKAVGFFLLLYLSLGSASRWPFLWIDHLVMNPGFSICWGLQSSEDHRHNFLSGILYTGKIFLTCQQSTRCNWLVMSTNE